MAKTRIPTQTMLLSLLQEPQKQKQEEGT